MALMYKSKEITISSADCDKNGLIKPSEVWNHFQDMAGWHAEDLGVGFDDMIAQGLIWVILYEQFVVIKDMPKVNDKVILNTWPKLANKLELEREYEMRDLDGNLLIQGVSNWTLIDVNTRRIARADRITFEGEYYQNCNFKEKQKRKIGLKFDNFIQEYDYKIVDSDIDHNKHLNNAKYLDIIANMNVINDQKIKRIEISFVHEAYLGNTIHIGYNKDENGNLCFIGTANDNPCFEARYELEV